MKTLRYLPLLCLMLLTSCISFQIKDTQDGIVSANYTLIGVNNTITALVTNKQISKAKAIALAKQSDAAEVQLKLAASLLRQGLPQSSIDALRIANSLLLSLQRELEAK